MMERGGEISRKYGYVVVEVEELERVGKPVIMKVLMEAVRELTGKDVYEDKRYWGLWEKVQRAKKKKGESSSSSSSSSSPSFSSSSSPHFISSSLPRPNSPEWLFQRHHFKSASISATSNHILFTPDPTSMPPHHRLPIPSTPPPHHLTVTNWDITVTLNNQQQLRPDHLLPSLQLRKFNIGAAAKKYGADNTEALMKASLPCIPPTLPLLVVENLPILIHLGKPVMVLGPGTTRKRVGKWEYEFEVKARKKGVKGRK